MAKIPTYDAISDLSTLDKLYIVDVSDTTDDATGSSKSISISDLIEWQPCTSWTYVSASTFTCVGNQTAAYRKGAKIKFTQSAAVKYAVVKSSAFTSVTTVTIIVSSDYTLANAAITANYISYIENPAGWPGYFNWAGASTGFSSEPANGIYRYCVINNRIECTIRQPANGTSNANTFTISAPVAPLTIANGSWVGYGFVLDNNAAVDAPGRLEIESAQTAITIYKTYAAASTGWTTSNGKRVVAGSIVYPF